MSIAAKDSAGYSNTIAGPHEYFDRTGFDMADLQEARDLLKVFEA